MSLRAIIASVLAANTASHWLSSMQAIHDNDSVASANTKPLVIAIGKAAASMVAALNRDSYFDGRCIIPAHSPLPENFPAAVTLLRSSHPLPSTASLQATHRLKEFITRHPHRPLHFFISGGTSALIEEPINGLTIAQLNQLSAALISAEIDIAQINHVRQRLSQIKAGGFLSWIARQYALDHELPAIKQWTLSDVPGDDPSLVGSGLLFAPSLQQTVAPNIVARLTQLMQDRAWPSPLCRLLTQRLIEPPKTQKRSSARAKVGHYLVGNSARMAEAMAAACAKQWPNTLIECQEVNESMEAFVQRCLTLLSRKNRVFIFHGEIHLSIIDHPGCGGRNSHLALRMAKHLAEYNAQQPLSAEFAAVATDGDDGNTRAAGAIVDQGTWLKLDRPGRALAEFDSFSVLQIIGATFTHTAGLNNVRDIYLLKIN
ncbi:MAG: DUF4147 domain-containing protein [Gammaproteobacteria bacterium]|nr:DUF4147 domain-containing protein [Gammaproteobacteria bacterium]